MVPDSLDKIQSYAWAVGDHSPTARIGNYIANGNEKVTLGSILFCGA
jgi:hypothetical protein